MIARLTGVVADLTLTHVVIDVGGVGYLVGVRKPSEFHIGDTLTLHTHLAVRENAMDLYGFSLKDELSMFEMLLTVPQIGPKSALQILAQADTALLTAAIVKNDASYLTKMSGIGKKTAEKIVANLKDKFEHMEYGDVRSTLTESDTDLVDALIALGYSQKDARDALQELPSDLTDTNARIKAALKLLGTGR